MPLPKLDVPVYETTLISSGKKIKFRPFLVKEQKLFLMASESNEPQEIINTIKQVLSNCILSKDVEIDNLPVFDLEYLFLQLRAKSVSEVVNLKYNCNNDVTNDKGETKKCNNTVKIDINLLEVQPTKNPEHNCKIQLTPKLGMMMRYPTFDIVEKISTENESELLNLLVSCIDYIYDDKEIYYAKDSTKEELEEFIENLQQSDLEKIQKFFQTMPKITKNVHFKCNKCNYEEDINLEGVQSFFV